MVVHQQRVAATDEDLRTFFDLESHLAADHRRCSTATGACPHRRDSMAKIDVVLDQWLTRHPRDPSSCLSSTVSANVSDETV